MGIIDVYKALTDKMEDKDPNKAAILNDLTSKYKAAIGATQSYLYGKGDSLAPLNLKANLSAWEMFKNFTSTKAFGTSANSLVPGQGIASMMGINTGENR